MHKLLIVDDEELVRRGIRAFVDFKKLDILEVYEASNGLEAFDLFQKHRPNLILMDINMPKMNGIDLAKKIKADNPRVKIALLTGYDYFDYAISALRLGIDDYVMKPVSRTDISDLLIKLIGRYEQDHQMDEVYKIVEQLLKETGTDPNQHYKAAIKDKLNDELSNPQLSLTYLADLLGFSTSYLSGLIKELFGMPFQDYVLTSRLEKAKLLLLSTDLKNYEVAEKIGFEDPNYFGTRFKKQYGISPKQYQQKVRGKGEGV